MPRQKASQVVLGSAESGQLTLTNPCAEKLLATGAGAAVLAVNKNQALFT